MNTLDAETTEKISRLEQFRQLVESYRLGKRQGMRRVVHGWELSK